MRGDDVNKDDEKILDELLGEREPTGMATEADIARLVEMSASSRKNNAEAMNRAFGEPAEEDLKQWGSDGGK